MHDDEVPIDEQTAHALVGEHFPQWRELTVTRLSTDGTVNAIFRLGEQLVARFPLRLMGIADAYAWLVAEQAAQREFAAVSPFRSPVPQGIGAPGHGYPMPYAVQTWVPGRVPRLGEASDSEALAVDLAELIQALRAAPTRGRTFAGLGRGGALCDHDEWVDECIALNAPWFDPSVTAALWTRMRELPREDPDAMTHGDLVPGNVLVQAGRLDGVLDTGGFGPADPALELVCAWHLLDARRRARLRSALGSSDLEWERARAWAFQQAMGLVHYYVDTNPGAHALGLRTLREVLRDE